MKKLLRGDHDHTIMGIITLCATIAQPGILVIFLLFLPVLVVGSQIYSDYLKKLAQLPKN